MVRPLARPIVIQLHCSCFENIVTLRNQLTGSSILLVSAHARDVGSESVFALRKGRYQWQLVKGQAALAPITKNGVMYE